MNESPFTLIPKVTIHPGYIVTHKEVQWHDYSKKKARVNVPMPENNDHQGIISKRSAAKIRKGISWLLYIANEKEVPSSYHGKTFKFKLSFITLTLASQQKHSDHEIKTKLLNQFLIEARKKWHVVNYLWRAEPQKNGNIHFHILCDRFVPWSELRDCWNRIQNKLGYVDRYREERREFHKGGFRVRQELLSKWDYKNQLRAYRTGSKKDWNSPNSTDIHSVVRIKNLPQYLAKYCTKNEGGRKIEGNLWNLSASLSNIKGASEVVDSFMGEELTKICQSFPGEIHKHDYYTIMYVSVNEWSKVVKGDLYDLFLSYVNEYKNKFT
jgi:hypothetical protein